MIVGKQKLVIKLGSSLLVADGQIRKKWLRNFAKNIADLVAKNFQITIVSSGAIALGRSVINASSIPGKQAAAAIGQIELMSSYRDFFAEENLHVAQILLTAADCNARERYLNSQNTLETLLKNQVIPIINENDTVAVDEIKIGDNDRLAARVAQMISADLLILFSDIDGLYDKNPRTHKNAHLIHEVVEITKEIEEMAGGTGSTVGTGGMVTKILAAKMLTNSKCDTVITSGIAENSLKELVDGKQNFTIFRGRKNLTKSRKTWISGVINTKGEVVINRCAVEVLQKRKSSLLPVGVVVIKGDFKKGEAIFIRDESGNHVASGLSNYDSSDARKLLGKKSSEVKKIFGKAARPELVHLDNMVLV